MKIKAKTKENTVEFEPEGSLECYQLGYMFINTPHKLSIKGKNLEKVIVSTQSIWKHLTK